MTGKEIDIAVGHFISSSAVKVYEDWLAKRRQPLERSTQNPSQASKSASEPLLGELKPQTITAPSKFVASNILAGDQGDRLSRDNVRNDVYDEREKQRQRKRIEEAEKFKNSKLFTKTDRTREQDVVSCDASQTRSIKVNEPDESTAQAG